MAKYTLTIDPTYQQTEWGLSEAVRELVANAHDAEKRGQGRMEVRHRGDKLHIVTHGVKLPLNTLLMGTSGARTYSDNIGQFGEGLAMSLKTLALLQAQGSLDDVSIVNDDESWRPKIEWSDEWSAHVLTITTRAKRKPSGSFAVTLTGIDKEIAAQIFKLFLFLDKGYKRQQTLLLSTGERLLLQPEFAGRLYVKGVFVRRRDDLKYGYDLDMRLNRDRKMMDEWDLKWKLSRVLGQAIDDHPERFADKLDDMLESGDSLEVQDGAFLKHSSALTNHIRDSFKAKHGGEAIPVSNMAEAREVEGLGEKAVVVTKAVKTVIESVDGTLEVRKARKAMKATTTYSWSDLDTTEKEVLGSVAALVDGADIIPGGKSVMYTLQIVDFASPKMLGRCDRQTGEIRLARKLLTDVTETLNTLVHEVAHLIPKADDGTQLHADIQIEVLCQIITRRLGSHA